MGAVRKEIASIVSPHHITHPRCEDDADEVGVAEQKRESIIWPMISHKDPKLLANHI
jgi:hypothetical protein